MRSYFSEVRAFGTLVRSTKVYRLIKTTPPPLTIPYLESLDFVPKLLQVLLTLDFVPKLLQTLLTLDFVPKLLQALSTSTKYS